MPQDLQSNVVTNQTLSDILLSQHAISKEQYNEIKVKSASQAVSEDTVIEQAHLVNEDKLAEAKAKLLGIPFVSLSASSFSPQALSFVPRAVAGRFSLIPFLYDEESKTLSVAMANPVDLQSLEFVRQKTGLTIKAFSAMPVEATCATDHPFRQELV